jgi:hypothetical protein
VLVDLREVTKPRTLCTLMKAYSLVRFYSATEISYVPLSSRASSEGTTSRLVRTNVMDQVTRTFVSAETGTIEAWDWSPDGNTLAYFAGDQLWLKAGNQPAASIASFKKQGGRGGGWDDAIAIRFSPTGTYFVLVHTVTVPNTFQIRRASDGAMLWASPSSDFRGPGFATMPLWSRGVDRLYFRDGNGVRRWDPSGTVTTLVAGLRWYEPSISPDGRAIAYVVLDAQSNPRVELLDLQTLKVRALPSPLRWRPMFASAGLLLYGKADGNGLPGQGVFAYDLNTGLETELPYATLLDVWPSPDSPSPAATCPINPLPGLCVGRSATSQEEEAMIRVGRPAAEKDLGLKDWSACSGNEQCFRVGSPSRAMVGTNAGTFYGESGMASGSGGGAGCFVFLYEDATGWHYFNARCAQAAGSLPGPHDLIRVSGCANVRDAPGLSSRVVACLPNGSEVDVDSAPVYADGHIWWHLTGRGWMAHDYLT